MLPESRPLRLFRRLFGRSVVVVMSLGSPAAASAQPVRLLPALTLRGHEAPVTAVAFAADSRTVASASWDRTVRVWDLASGVARAVLRGHTGAIQALAFSPDGKWLASAAEDGTIRIWDLSTGQSRQTLREHTGTVYTLGFSPDGRQLASGSSDQSVLVWDTNTWRVIWRPTNQFGEVYAVAFDPGGRWLASGSGDGHVRVWDRQTSLLIQFLGDDGADAVWGLQFNPDGSRLVATISGSRHHVWQTDRFAEVPVCAAPDAARARGVIRAAIGGNGGYVLVGSPAGDPNAPEAIEVWNLAGTACGDPVALVGHRGPVWGVAASADGGWVASGSADSVVRVWIPTWSNPIGVEGAKAALQRFHPRDEFETSAEYRTRLVAGRRTYMDELTAARAVVDRRIAESRRDVEVPAFRAGSGLELGRYDADAGRFRIRIEGRDSVLYMSPTDARELAQKRNETIIEAVQQLATDGIGLVLVNRVLIHPTTGQRYPLGTRIELRAAQPPEPPPERPPVER